MLRILAHSLHMGDTRGMPLLQRMSIELTMIIPTASALINTYINMFMPTSAFTRSTCTDASSWVQSHMLCLLILLTVLISSRLLNTFSNSSAYSLASWNRLNRINESWTHWSCFAKMSDIHSMELITKMTDWNRIHISTTEVNCSLILGFKTKYRSLAIISQGMATWIRLMCGQSS